jgi:tripartite-type tricarboxylate transporter receptor subunit TctC
MRVRTIALCLGLALGIAPGAAPASVADYPSGNIRFIVNVAAGGVTDTLARLIGQGLTEKWGKPVIVENRAVEIRRWLRRSSRELLLMA